MAANTGDRIDDQNVERTLGLQALIHAVRTCQPGFDFTKVSVVTEREPVRCLLGFVCAEPVAFRFGITIIGKTALFASMEKTSRKHNSKQSHGYRDAFKEQYTKISAQAARAISHHRVVKYDFAGETILLQYTVDAYLREVAEALMQADGIKNTDPGPWLKQRKREDIDSDPYSRILPSNTPITVVEGGHHIPHAATLELTTRAEHSQAPDSIESKIPDFWLSQTPKFHLCLHREKVNGESRSTIFNCIRLVPMGLLLTSWEEANAKKLRALAYVLLHIRKAAKELGGGSCIVSSDGGEGTSLVVSRAEGEDASALPEDMQSLFEHLESEPVDESKKRELAQIASTASENGTRKRKYGSENAPKPTCSPPARRVAPDSTFRRPAEVTVPVGKENLAAAGQTPYDGTRKRKLDAVGSPELTDSSPARRRALNSRFRTPKQSGISMDEEDPGVKMNDEPLDSETVMQRKSF